MLPLSEGHFLKRSLANPLLTNCFEKGKLGCSRHITAVLPGFLVYQLAYELLCDPDHEYIVHLPKHGDEVWHQLNGRTKVYHRKKQQASGIRVFGWHNNRYRNRTSTVKAVTLARNLAVSTSGLTCGIAPLWFGADARSCVRGSKHNDGMIGLNGTSFTCYRGNFRQLGWWKQLDLGLMSLTLFPPPWSNRL
jgi:hypothetical protein